MTFTRKSFILSFLLLLSFLFSLPAWAGVENAARHSDFLFVLLAKNGDIKTINGQPGHYQLVLRKVNPEVIYFTNRPERKTGKVMLSDFLQRWQSGGFRQVPPNAVLEAVRLRNGIELWKDKQAVNYAVELTQPVYQQNKNLLTFTIKPLNGEAQPLDLNKADYIALFIDSTPVCPDCVG